MTNINCSSNCIYQKDGKCIFSSTLAAKVNANNDCPHYVASDNKKS